MTNRKILRKSNQTYRAANRELFNRYQTNRDISLRNEILMANLGLAKKVAHRFSLGGIQGFDYESCLSIASGALLKAVENYDPSEGATFSTYATVCMKKSFFRPLEGVRMVRVPGYALKPVIEYLVDEASEESQLCNFEHLDALSAALETLKPSEAEVIKRRYGLGDTKKETIEEVSKGVKKSRDWVRKIESRAIIKLWKQLEIYSKDFNQ